MLTTFVTRWAGEVSRICKSEGQTGDCGSGSAELHTSGCADAERRTEIPGGRYARPTAKPREGRNG